LFTALLAKYTGSSRSGDTLTVTGGSPSDGRVINVTYGGTPEVPPSLGFARAGGVIITSRGDITDSNLTVDSNVVQGQAIGNVASNVMTIAATVLTGETVAVPPSAGSLAAGTFGAENDYIITNVQEVTSGSSSRSDVYSVFAIDQAFDNVLADSALSVSGNRQTSEAMGNNGSNRLTLSATDMASVTDYPAASVASLQFGAANVDALSDMVAYANVASTNSAIALDDNRNTAVGVINNVVNAVSVAATNIVGADTDGYADQAFSYGSAHATFELANAQLASGPSTLDTLATSSVTNTDATDTAVTGGTTGVAGGTVSLSANTNFAEATVNRAVNGLSVGGGASNGATSAMSNNQASVSTVQATATGSVVFTLYGNGANEAADTSSITVGSNVNQALARGNSADNTLASSASASLVGATAVNAGATPAQALATTALLNGQTSTGGTIGATATGTFGTTLSGTTVGAVTASSVALNGNTTASEALANRAFNSVTVAGGASNNATGALVNLQTSSTAVSASAVSAVNAVLTGGTGSGNEALAGSSVAIRGNVTQAVARGNVALNAMAYTAGANFTSPTLGASVTGSTSTGAAAAAVLNSQTNSGAVSATAANSVYAVALNGTPGITGAAALNSSVSVSGNSVAALAHGNQASSTLGLTALNTGNATAAANNVQSNSGVITASVTSVAFTINTTGTVTSGSMRNIGNAAIAQAVGNSAMTILGAR
jgi:hypothetical protein